ncbi:MAG TPA: thioredoxin family protein [Nitrososphaerales archaeon]|nr:thioredoxin family protein [Nitrososphaerales archaeon]
MNVSNWLDKTEFQKIIAEPGPHLVVFAAKWCGFCTRFIGQAKVFESSVSLSLIDADEPDESLWDDFSIKIVPTIAVFDNGKIVFRRDGKSGMGLGLPDLEAGIAQAKAA